MAAGVAARRPHRIPVTDNDGPCRAGATATHPRIHLLTYGEPNGLAHNETTATGAGYR